MGMSLIWTLMVGISVLCGLAGGREAAVAAAAMEGAAAAVELCLSMAGVLCLWMGVMEVMKRSGLAEGLSRLLRPLLRRLYPDFARDQEVMDSISANVSANLLGLGNAATPLGIQAARQMSAAAPPGWLPTPCVCWWYVIRPPSSSSPLRWPASVRRQGAPPPSTSCRRCGWPPLCRWRWVSRRPGSWPGCVRRGPRCGGGGRDGTAADHADPPSFAGGGPLGLIRRVDVYDALATGAGEGLSVLIRIAPPLVALLTAVYMLRASGALELAARALGPLLETLGIPPETVGLLLIRPVSGSAALGVGAELISLLRAGLSHRPDSGGDAGSTETTFYTVAVYFGAAGIVRTPACRPGCPVRRRGGLFGGGLGHAAAVWGIGGRALCLR